VSTAEVSRADVGEDVCELPQPRGPVTESLFKALLRSPGSMSDAIADQLFIDDALFGEDTPLALYSLYELHYRGFLNVNDGWEWDPNCLELRRNLERAFIRQLRHEVTDSYGSLAVAPNDVVNALRELMTRAGPSLATFMSIDGTPQHVREFSIHRSPYQGKEADPHTWAIPRLRGQSKAALVLIQFGEYGDGQTSKMHAELFSDALESMGLERRCGAHLDKVPGASLSAVNLVSLFGLHRRWRGALVGHLALFEMCAVNVMSHQMDAMRRLGIDGAIPFYAAHVESDVAHERIALNEMVGGLLVDEPALCDDVMFGARALDLIERKFTERLLSAWSIGESSLRCERWSPRDYHSTAMTPMFLSSAVA
jgi:hypothetical protein